MHNWPKQGLGFYGINLSWHIFIYIYGDIDVNISNSPYKITFVVSLILFVY